MTRGFAGKFGLAAVIALLMSCLSVPIASAAGTGAPSLNWQDCGDGFQCATAAVPADYDNSLGPTVTLSLVRIPASDPSRRIGTAFIGAPGSLSSVVLLRAIGAGAYDARIHERFDLVAIDRRGVGGSAPVRCFPSNAEAEAFYGQYPTYPTTRAELESVDRLNNRFAASCGLRSGRLLPHLSSADVARDLDRLRAAVGDEALTFIGYSHSAYVGIIYANLFPRRVRALVLDGPQFAPALTSGGADSTPFSRSEADLAAETALREFFARCAAAGPDCAFSEGTAGEIKAKYDRLRDRLATTPVQSPLSTYPGMIGADDLALIASNGLFSADSYRTLAAELQALHESSSGTGAVQGTDAGEAYDNSLDALAGMFCSELDSPSSVTGYELSARRRAQVAPNFGAFYAWYQPRCEDWPGPSPDRYTGPWQSASAVPALFVANEFDPIAHLPGVEKAATLLPGSVLLKVHGWGHLAILSSGCVDDAIGQYVVDRQLPPRGQVCESDVRPFG
jgi:pimeloyl-ACP methyl ester carboxylesterase